MSDRQDFKRNLRNQAAASSRHTDALLDEELQALLSMSRDRLEELRPRINDEEEYDKLITAVEDATRNNEAAAQFRQRLVQGGVKVLRMAKIAAGLSIGL